MTPEVHPNLPTQINAAYTIKSAVGSLYLIKSP